MKKLTHSLTLSIGTLTLKLTGTTLVEDVGPNVEPSAAPKPRKDNRPTSQEALWCAALFKRSPQTEWSDKEIGAYVKHKALLTPENRALLQAYYEAERAKGEQGVHRRDLQTFLNNLPGEADRAKAKPLNGTHHSAAGRFGA